MADISITITSDPTQAVTDINQVKKAAEDLATTSKKVAESSAADNSQAVNQVLTVSRQAQQAVTQTGTAVGAVSTGIKTAAGEASKMAGAFGSAVPVVGRLGSAIAAAITGPIGAISAAVGLAIAGINKMIADAKDKVEALKLSAGSQTNTAYNRLMQGRADYAAQLQVLSQVREINNLAQTTALSASELAKFRQLAAQIGIDERDVSARGIRSGKLSEASKSLNQQRAFYAEQEYNAYIESLGNQLSRAIESSNLDSAMKTRLGQKGLFGAADMIRYEALKGGGATTEEYKAWQDLYSIIKPLAEVQASYMRDAMLGRSQADLNAAALASITKAHEQKPDSGAAAGGAPQPGTLAWQKEQDQKAMAAMEAERKEQERRTAAAAGITEKLEQEIEIQKLINDGKLKEAYLLRQRLNMEAALGRALTDEQQAALDASAGELYDLQHPADPSLAPSDTIADARVGAQRTARRMSAGYTVPLDRLQRIGANVTNPAVSPEKAVMDKQLTVQEQIRNILQSNFTAAQQTGGAIFP